MPKRTKALSGAAQDAYFRRVLKTKASLSAEERETLVRRLRQEIAQVRLRRAAAAEPAGAPVASAATEAIPVEGNPADARRAALSTPAALPGDGGTEHAPDAGAAPFDPYSPNVIVVLRKGGREAALSALGGIESIQDLRLLAQEQRLSIDTDLSSPAELRAAIVAAAERRVANRLAAAS